MMWHSILCPTCHATPCRCYWYQPPQPLYPGPWTEKDTAALKPFIDSVAKRLRTEPTWEERLDWQLNEYKEWLNSKLGKDIDAPMEENTP